jgi:DNA polymerase-3 subunit delta'
MPFRDVIGHRRLVGLLSRAITRESLPPSLILAGPRGVGKRLVALAVAQTLNCPRRGPGSLDSGSRSSEHAPVIDACGTCPTCTRIARGVYPDVIIVEPGDNGSIKIDQVRDIIDRAGFRPFEGQRRAVIIDDADRLVPAAQNALLKTLEEPPPSSVFMLVTSRPDTLLPTVLSRCPRLRFRSLSSADVAAALMRNGRSESEARAVAATAEGSVGRALEATAGDLVQAREVAGRVLMCAVSTDDPPRRLDGTRDLLSGTGSGGAVDRDQLATHLRVMASLVRDVELMSTSADVDALANPDVRPIIDRLSAYRGQRGIRAFTAIDEALAALERNAGVKVVADWVMLEL